MVCVALVSPRVLTKSGKTRTDGSHTRAADLSLGTLLSDMLGVVTHIFPDPKESPSFVVRSHTSALLTTAARPFHGCWTYLECISRVAKTWLYRIGRGRCRCRRRSVTSTSRGLQLIDRYRSRGTTAHEEYSRSTTLFIQISSRCYSLAVCLNFLLSRFE